jgi:hypothetical protein
VTGRHMRLAIGYRYWCEIHCEWFHLSSVLICSDSGGVQRVLYNAGSVEIFTVSGHITRAASATPGKRSHGAEVSQHVYDTGTAMFAVDLSRYVSRYVFVLVWTCHSFDMFHDMFVY